MNKATFLPQLSWKMSKTYSGHSLLHIRKPGFICSNSSLSGMGTRVGFKWFLLPNINSESCSQPEPHACWHQKLSARRNHAWGKAEVTQLSSAEPDAQTSWWHGYSQPDIDRGDAPPTSTTYLVFWDKPYSAFSGVVFLQHEWGRNEANGSMSGLISFHFKAEEVTASCLFVCFLKTLWNMLFWTLSTFQNPSQIILETKHAR